MAIRDDRVTCIRDQRCRLPEFNVVDGGAWKAALWTGKDRIRPDCDACCSCADQAGHQPAACPHVGGLTNIEGEGRGTPS